MITLVMMLAVAGIAGQPKQPPLTLPPAPATPGAPTSPPTAQPDAAPHASPVKFPHPLITEVLYAVPTGEKGDANHDSTRDATGDEFIEVFNPHQRAIDLRGYTLQDRSKGRAGAMSFTFPPVMLQPGQCAVVFNGNGSTWTGPIGDEHKAPEAVNPSFDHAWVFTMRTTSTRTALANGGDAVLLVAPDRKVVQIVRWGKFEEKLPQCDLEEEAPTVTKCSVQHKTIDGPFVAHDVLEGKLPFSPGSFGKAPPPPTEAPRVTEPNPRTPGDDKAPAKKGKGNPPPPPR